MYGKLKEFLTNELEGIKAAGLYKNERIITTPQRADIKVNAGSDVLNFCANNYLGLSDNQRLIKAAKEAMDMYSKTQGTKGILVQKAGSTLAPSTLYKNTLQNKLDDIDTQIEKWQDKMADQVDRYTSKFTALEKLISQMNSQSSALASFLGSNG